jgi:hypothetical protein
MGVEVMEMAKMKVGITIPVGPALRALFREASGAVEVRAWASHQALGKAERWGWDLEPTHLSFATSNAPTLAFGENGATTLSLDDVPLSKPLTIQGLALEVIRHFLEEMEGRVELHFGPSSLSVLNRYLGPWDGSREDEELELSIIARDSYGGHDKVKVLEGGGVSVEVSWGEPSWWDGWVVSPEGLEYVGTVDGPRYPPRWLIRALEEARARGV